MRQMRSYVLACALAAVSLACSDGTPPSIPPPSLDSCSAGWQAITAPRDAAHSFGRSLDHREGELYYFDVLADYTMQIEAQPIAGGEPRVVAQTKTTGDLWLRDDQLYYARDARLWRVPVAGGEPVDLFSRDAAFYDNRGTIETQALSPTALFWRQWNYDSAGTYRDEIWSQPLDGNSPAAYFAPTRDFWGVLAMAAFANDIIVAGLVWGMGVTGMVYPLDGSAPRELARAGHGPYDFIGMDERGIYGSDFASETQMVMHLAPADGSPAQRFWRGMPSQYLPLKLWPDGKGNYLMVGDELFADGIFHKSLFFIDSQGNGTRVACDAALEGFNDHMEDRPAFSDDAAYLYMVDLSYLDTDSSTHSGTWQIVKIPRP